MPDRERRISDAPRIAELRAELSPEQNAHLTTLEHFGWELRFIRRPLFQTPVPVVVEPKTGRYAVLRPDGTLDDEPGFDIRD